MQKLSNLLSGFKVVQRGTFTPAANSGTITISATGSKAFLIFDAGCINGNGVYVNLFGTLATSTTITWAIAGGVGLAGGGYGVWQIVEPI